VLATGNEISCAMHGKQKLAMIIDKINLFMIDK
jgi:hypothetical protein